MFSVGVVSGCFYVWFDGCTYVFESAVPLLPGPLAGEELLTFLTLHEPAAPLVVPVFGGWLVVGFAFGRWSRGLLCS